MNKQTIKTIVFLCLPSVVFAILSNRRAEDRRPIKYFLPYWKVRSHILSFYNIEHVRKVYGPKLEQPLMKGFKGFIRSWLPFGLVLWLDKGASFVFGQSLTDATFTQTKPVLAKQVYDVDKMAKEFEAIKDELSARQDRLEVLLLRILAQQKK